MSFQTYQMSRAVRMFAIVDIIFLVVWSFNYYMLGIGVVLTVCGYFGARNYRPALVFSVRFFFSRDFCFCSCSVCVEM
jgi:hypothetical protein